MQCKLVAGGNRVVATEWWAWRQRMCSRRAGTTAQVGGQPDAAAQPNTFRRSPSQQEEQPTSAYLHLPFCKRKCFYCDFPGEAGVLGSRLLIRCLLFLFASCVTKTCGLLTGHEFIYPNTNLWPLSTAPSLYILCLFTARAVEAVGMKPQAARK